MLQYMYDQGKMTAILFLKLFQRWQLLANRAHMV